jgi:hypothetical protein
MPYSSLHVSRYLTVLAAVSGFQGLVQYSNSTAHGDTNWQTVIDIEVSLPLPEDNKAAERMEELPGIIIAIVVIFFIARYFSSELPGCRAVAPKLTIVLWQAQSRRTVLLLLEAMVRLPPDHYEACLAQW